jgi:ATP-dependent DNA helicase RecG
LKIGYFETNVDLRYQDEVAGDLIFQVNQALEVLKTKYLRAWISYEGLQRIESWPVPMPALREAVLNAVVHKDYASGAPIQISVYPDKLLIWNPGELPPNWTVEKLLSKHASIPFNPDVASVFFRAGMIESWGRGIERLLEACQEAHTPAPDLRYEHTALWVEFRFLPEHTVSTTPKVTGEVEIPNRRPQKQFRGGAPAQYSLPCHLPCLRLTFPCPVSASEGSRRMPTPKAFRSVKR